MTKNTARSTIFAVGFMFCMLGLCHCSSSSTNNATPIDSSTNSDSKPNSSDSGNSDVSASSKEACIKGCNKAAACYPSIFGGSFQTDCLASCEGTSATTQCATCIDSASCPDLLAGKCTTECGGILDGGTVDSLPPMDVSTTDVSPVDAPAPTDASTSDGGKEDSIASICPYTTSSLSCDSACTNIIALAATCATDPNMPPNLKTLMTAINNAPSATKLTTCKATCAVDSPKYPNQWKCFQGAPATSCTGVAGCTAGNCP